MTDTEILDYLSDSYTLRRNAPADVQIGSVTLTVGLKPGSLRELLEDAIARDQQRTVDQVTRKLLTGTEPPPNIFDDGVGDNKRGYF